LVAYEKTKETIEARMLDMPKITIRQYYSLLILPTLEYMRTQYIQGTGRTDVVFPDNLRTLSASSTPKTGKKRGYNDVYSPKQFLETYGFANGGTENLYGSSVVGSNPDINKCGAIFKALNGGNDVADTCQRMKGKHDQLLLAVAGIEGRMAQKVRQQKTKFPSAGKQPFLTATRTLPVVSDRMEVDTT